MKKHHLIWNENLHSVGIASIDSQHRELIEWINELSDVIAESDQSEVVQEVLDGLILFTREHFAFEERLMVKYGFPGMEDHIEVHHRLFLQLNNLIRANVSTPRHNKAVLVSAFLTDWAEQHILMDDMELGKFLGNINEVGLD